MKKRRQAKILELISSREIETQEELQELLSDNGIDVTQATISRDIKELRLVKDLSTQGKYYYSTGKRNNENITRRAGGIFNESIIKIDYAMNIVCITCFAGMANAVCDALESMTIDNVLGSIAGDDTIFILCSNENAAMNFTYNLRKMLNA